MRMLFVAGGSAATVFALAPLATAARNAGHEVFMAANDDMTSVITSVGLPAISAGPQPISHFIYADRSGQPVEIPADPAEQALFTGRWFGRMAAAWRGPLLDLAAAWAPDVVVGGTMAYAAPLLAAQLGIPHVRHAWDIVEATQIDPGADAELGTELGELGLDRVPPPDLFIDVCPPSLGPPVPPQAQRTERMRWICGNAQRRLEPWMYTRGARPRICLTSGSRVAREGDEQDFRRHAYEFLRALAAELATLDADLVIAAPDAVGARLKDELGDIQAGWVPLDVLAPRCDLLVHHGGGATCMTALSMGLAQVIIPQGAVLVPPARRVARYGAGITLADGDDSPSSVAKACQEILGTPSYSERAAGLAEEIAMLPAPAEALRAVERLA
jgi:glycosyltransferase